VSEIQDDKKALKGRKAPEEITEVPLKDRIVKKLFDKLVEEKFGAKLTDIWTRGNANRSEYLKRRQLWLADYDNFIPESVQSEESFSGFSNLHIPLTFIVGKTYHARALQALTAVEPRPKSRHPASQDREQMIADVMRYVMKDYANEYRGIVSVLDTWIWYWALEGASTLKSRWERKFEQFVDVAMVPEPKTIFVATDQGEQAVPDVELVEREVERTIPVFDGPVVEHVAEEDILVVGGNGDPQKADSVHQQYPLTASDLWSYADQGIFDEDAVKEVIKSGGDPESSGESGNRKEQEKAIAGQATGPTDIDHDRYLILESYVRKDCYGSGHASEIVVWHHVKTNRILRATYLRRINKSGERPYHRIEFHRRHNSPHPMGLVEILYPIAKEMDAIHNMRVDSGLIATLPFFFYRASSSLEPETIRYEPGSGIPLDDPQRDVYFPNLGNRSSFFIQEEQVLQTMVERLTGISDLTLGVMNGNQGPARTATGVRGLVGQSNANLDVHYKRMFEGFRPFLKHLLHMLQQRIPAGLAFRVTGEDGKDYWRQVRSQEDLAGDFDFEMDPSSADSDPQVRLEKATQVFNLVMNPLLIQLGAVNQVNVFEAGKNLLQALGVKDWARFLQMPPQDALILTPEEEAQRVLRGIPVPVSLNGDHEGFLAYFDFLMKTPELLGQFNPDQVQSLAAQAKKHEEMAAALQQVQAQASNVQQMQFNAAQSQQQGGPGTNPMATSGLIA
jgi:hypothetical protein